jgi:hypothetical protein
VSRGPKLTRVVPALAEGPPLCTLTDALRLIDRDVPKERRHVPHWRRTRELLTRALRSKDPAVIEKATDHLERALRAERSASERQRADEASATILASTRSRPDGE